MRFLLLVSAMLGLSVCQLGAQSTLPPNTIDCSAFTKLPNGEWHVGKTTTFDLGKQKGMEIGNQDISPRALSFGGFDLYDVLERKCGGTHT